MLETIILNLIGFAVFLAVAAAVMMMVHVLFRVVRQKFLS